MTESGTHATTLHWIEFADEPAAELPPAEADAGRRRPSFDELVAEADEQPVVDPAAVWQPLKPPSPCPTCGEPVDEVEPVVESGEVTCTPCGHVVAAEAFNDAGD